MERGSQCSARFPYVRLGPVEVDRSFRGNLGPPETQKPANRYRSLGVIGSPYQIQIKVTGATANRARYVEACRLDFPRREQG